MRDAWHDEDFVRRWETEDVLRTNPERDAQLSLLAALIAESHADGDRLLDLGIGSGLVEDVLLERIGGLRVVGVDHSEAMLERARARHAARDNVRLVAGGFADLDSLAIPGPRFEFVICVQALHEVTHDVKRSLFAFVRRRISGRGLFLILDRFDYEAFALAPELRCLWERLSADGPRPPLSFDEYRARYEAKSDHPGTVEQCLRWLRRAGFHAGCLHLHFNRALIAARPKTR